ncbi:MAG: hypothetical protein HY320_04710 [Armatimonadetes bacterium]|nr:hypothetical protein [Armatimonadota bacterium]
MLIAGGWLLVSAVAVALARRDPITLGSLGFTAAVATATLILARSDDFPMRRAALASSWVGPLILLLELLTWDCLGTAIRNVADLRIQYYLILAIFFHMGCWNALMMAWLSRGYGVILVFAVMAAIVAPGSRAKEGLREAAESYPCRGWWWWPLILLIIPLIAMTVIGILLLSYLFPVPNVRF